MSSNEEWMTSIIELDNSVAELTRRQSVQLNNARKGVRYLSSLMVVVMLLVLAGIFVVARVNNNSNSISKLQSQTSSDVLCPLWIRFLRAYNPKSPSALADPDGYEQSYHEIERGARILECTQTTRGLK